MSAPRLEIDLDKIHHNARILVERLAIRGISVTGITKATFGSPEIAEVFLDAGVKTLGHSRIENIETMRKAGVSAPITLIRSPMLSQVDHVVMHADISFNTELDVIKALSDAAQKLGRTHGIVLMIELGDLREGIMPGDVEDIVRKTCDLPNLEFKGIGTNLACRSGASPDTKNMAELSALADSLDTTFDFEMDIVSGGNSSNLEWVFSGADTGRINNLRLGEAILLGLNPLNREPIDGLHTNAFKLVAEVIESKVKPSKPWGEIKQAAFGTPSPIINQGNISQVILAIGEQDTDPNGLTPPPGIEILGASSDHLVLNAKENRPTIGDEIAFQLNYSALVRAMTSPFVAKNMSPHPVKIVKYRENYTPLRVASVTKYPLAS